MPIGCDTQQTFEVWLEVDKDKDPRPGFLIRYMSKRSWSAAVNLHDATYLRKDKTAETISSDITKALVPLVAGWKNILSADKTEKPFSADALEDVLTVHEAVELLDKAWRGQRPSFEDKKKLDSPSDSASGSPAEGAPG